MKKSQPSKTTASAEWDALVKGYVSPSSGYTFGWHRDRIGASH